MYYTIFVQGLLAWLGWGTKIGHSLIFFISLIVNKYFELVVVGVIIHNTTGESSKKMTMDAVFIIVSYLTIMRFHLIVLPDSCSVRVRLGGYWQWLLFFSSSQKGAFLKVFGIPSILEGKIHKDGATCSCLRSGLMCSYLLAFDFLQLSQYFFFFWLPFLFLLWCWEIKLRFCTC